MAVPVLITGKSGSGKSASMRNCSDFGIINVLGKPLPFKNDFKTIITDDYEWIKVAITKAHAKSLVIDDAGYLMTNQFMRGHSDTGRGNDIFAFYNTIGDSFWNLLQYIIWQLPAEKIVYLTMHEDKSDFGDIKPKSIGKMLDEKVCIEGMFTIVLRAVIEGGAHKFKVQSDGLDVCKSPIGLFEEKFIDNDLKLVDDKIREFYNI